MLAGCKTSFTGRECRYRRRSPERLAWGVMNHRGPFKTGTTLALLGVGATIVAGAFAVRPVRAPAPIFWAIIRDLFRETAERIEEHKMHRILR